MSDIKGKYLEGAFSNASLYDIFDIADADGNNATWSAGYFNGDEGGSADIDTTTADKAFVTVVADGTPEAAAYAIFLNKIIDSKFYAVVADVDCTFAAAAASWATTGLRISRGTFDVDNQIYIQRQESSGAPNNRITAGAIVNGAALGETSFTTADTTLALKIERLDNKFRCYYSLSQSPDEVWVLLAEFDDASNYLTSRTKIYLAAYTPGNGIGQSAQGDFGNFRLHTNGFVTELLARDTKTVVDDILVDTGTTLPAVVDEIPSETNAKSFNATALTAIENEAIDALQTMDLDHMLELDGAAQKYPQNCATDSIIAKMLVKADPAVPSQFDNSTDSLEAIRDAIDAGVVATNANVLQTFVYSMTYAANAGSSGVAQAFVAPCIVESVILHANAAQTADMDTCAVEAGDTQVITLIGIGDATQANLDALDKQLNWIGALRLSVTSGRIYIDFQGTGATAVDLTLTVTYRAETDGGYLATP